ncbi:MAG: hypothetical protein WB460_15055 [Candidatus Acidiferrales bacterium]
MRAEQIAELAHALPYGYGRWRGRCPVHLGRSRTSLSIAEGDKGRVLLKCWGGCTVEQVCAELKIEISDLFAEPRIGQTKPTSIRKAEKQVSDLRARLTPRERVSDITIVYCDPENPEAGMVRALALAVEGEIVQAVLSEGTE